MTQISNFWWPWIGPKIHRNEQKNVQIPIMTSECFYFLISISISDLKNSTGPNIICMLLLISRNFSEKKYFRWIIFLLSFFTDEKRQQINSSRQNSSIGKLFNMRVFLHHFTTRVVDNKIFLPFMAKIYMYLFFFKNILFSLWIFIVIR